MGAGPDEQGERGRSPRIVAADVVGSGGRTRVDGATIRARLGLYDSWAYFRTITAGRASSVRAPAGPPTPGSSGTALAGARPAGGLRGSILPARRGAAITLQRRDGGRWVTIGTTRAGAGGRYEAAVASAGTYRVRYGGDAGPPVRVR